MPLAPGPLVRGCAVAGGLRSRGGGAMTGAAPGCSDWRPRPQPEPGGGWRNITIWQPNIWTRYCSPHPWPHARHRSVQGRRLEIRAPRAVTHDIRAPDGAWKPAASADLPAQSRRPRRSNTTKQDQNGSLIRLSSPVRQSGAIPTCRGTRSPGCADAAKGTGGERLRRRGIR